MSPATHGRDRAYVPRVRSLEDRRRRGEVACAECRRLKLKCDRTIPCSSCIKRDCTELCPNASNVTKDTTRAVVAASQHLHSDIARLRRRARALEAALGNLHYKRAGVAHPLIGQDDDYGDEDDDVDDVERVSSDVGVLHLSAHDGAQQLFGNVELPQGVPVRAGIGKLPQLPPVLEQCIRSFPFPTPPGTHERAVAALRQFLPERAAAEQLLHMLFEDYLFTIPAMDKTMIFVELLPGLYDPRLARGPCVLSNEERGDSPRSFALLFAILAHGAILDSSDPERELRATFYSRLALAGMGAVSIFDKPSYLAVLVLLLLSAYHSLRQERLGEAVTFYGNLACQLAIQIGLFLDPTPWGLPWLTVQRRRRLCWSLTQVTMWESLANGRPPIIPDFAMINCEFPLDENTRQDPDGPKPTSEYGRFKRARDMVSRVLLMTTLIEPPQYPEILALDATIRAEWMAPSETNGQLSADLGKFRRTVILGPFRAFVLLSLHRGHFVKALEESPLDPIGSPYGTSFRTTVRSAWEIVQWIPKYFETDPGRSVYVMAQAWTWALTAAMVLFTNIKQATHSDCVYDVLAHLEILRDIFARAKELGGGRAASGLPALQEICISSRAILAARDTRPDRIAWPVELHEAWSPPATPQRRQSPDPGSKVSPSAPADQFGWLDDDVSDSFKGLFKSHYRDAQQPTLPSAAPSPTSSAGSPSPSAAGAYAYPGYLQARRPARPKRAAAGPGSASIRLPELLPDMPPPSRTPDVELGPYFLPPGADGQPPVDPGSLASIWLAHSHQLGAFSPTGSTTPSISSQGSSHHPYYSDAWPEWH